MTTPSLSNQQNRVQDAPAAIEKDYAIVYQPAGIPSRCSSETTILDDAARVGIMLRSDCGGKGTCGRCRVVATPEGHAVPPVSEELRLLSAEEIAGGYRLACALRPKGSLQISVPPESLDSLEVGDKTRISDNYDVDPMVERVVVPPVAQAPDRCEPLDLVEKLLADSLPAPCQPLNIEVIRQLARVDREEGITVIAHRKLGIRSVLRGRHQGSLGVAFDLGTTTLAAYLCDLTHGHVLASASAANPQRRHGEDVVSRIAYADEQQRGVETLQHLAATGLNRLLRLCLEQSGHVAADIDEVCLVGNPTMQHLILGVHPGDLGRAPYRPVFRRALDVRAADIGLDLPGGVNAHLFPLVSAFIGGDTVAAILADGTHEREEITLLIDIGTNGEVVIGNAAQLWATSCATGPALEGAHLSCGMRAVSGAVDRVAIDGTTYLPHLRVIGGGQALGLCGSGIVDAMAEMVRTGLILSNGRMKEGFPGVRVDAQGVGREFLLNCSDRPLAITLGDIRQVQLAKAALAAGISLLMQRAGYRRFDRLVLTGAFGAKFNWRNAMAIGMLPEIPAGATVEILENGAGKGAVQALLSARLRHEKDSFARKIQFFDLSGHPHFADTFALATAFPLL